MKVKKIKIQNFKSYGNNISEINLNTNTGELILLHGRNAAGKSSTLECIDYTIYGKVRGKKKKYLTNDTLPNRYNGNMNVEIDFESGQYDVNIKRSLSKLELTINGQEYDKAGKANKQNKIDDIVGIDIDTFKSFISMSINDFKNFMVLTPEEKRILLDKLFNLEMINELNKIVKEKRKQSKYQEDLFSTEVSSYEKSLASFKQSIDKLKEAEKNNIEKERSDIKDTIINKKEEFQKLKDKLDLASEKDLQIKDKIKDITTKISEADFKIRECDAKIRLLDLGKCPTCTQDIHDNTTLGSKSDLVELINSLKSLKDELRLELEDSEEKNSKLQTIIKNTQQVFGELKFYLSQLKTKLESIKDNKESESITELISSIDKIEKNKEESLNNLSEVKHKSALIAQLDKFFSEDGIKRSIIIKIVRPINAYIYEFIQKTGLPYTIELDDQFSANVRLLNQDIDPETLSTGESKIINICIVLSYLKMIKLRRHINLLFLDEVFSSIDISNVYIILDLSLIHI